MGKRKFKLGRHRKNEERKRQSAHLYHPGRPRKRTQVHKINKASSSLSDATQQSDTHAYAIHPVNSSPATSGVELHNASHQASHTVDNPVQSTLESPCLHEGGIGLHDTSGTSPQQLDVSWLSGNIKLPENWVKELSQHGATKLYKVVKFDDAPPIASHSIIVNADLTWSAYVRNVCLNSELKVQVSSQLDFELLVSKVDEYDVCIGNYDDKFVQMVKHHRSSQVMARNGKDVAAFLDQHAIVHNGKCYQTTVRTSSCPIVVKSKARCTNCTDYRSSLRSLYMMYIKKSRSCSPNVPSACHSNIRYLTTPERRERIATLRKDKLALQRQVNSLQKRIEKATSTNGVAVDEELQSDMTDVMDKCHSEIIKSYSPGSFRRVFWEQHYESIKKKDARQIKWHPAMIKWCLSLKFLSTSCYNTLRSANVIKLPSERTLRDYSNWTEATIGFSVGVDQQLLREANLPSSPEHHRYVSLIMDECKIKEDLVYNKHNGEMIGYTRLSDIDNHFHALEQGSTPEPELATHMLMIMVRGLFSSMKFPYVQFSTRSLTGSDIFSIFWNAVERLELLGFRVMAVICDGAASNRRFFKIHGNADTYKVKNPYSKESDRFIYFVSDVPHLMKTTRNCWANSNAHLNTRKLWINGRDIKWDTVVDLFEKHCSSGLGLSILPKLHHEHVFLTSYSKMRVDLAVQVLSKSVADAISLEENEGLKETERFVRFMNKMFDCLNVRCTTEHVKDRNPDKKPYYDVNDERLKWLKEDFLGYLSEWEKSVNERDGYSAAEKDTMMLSKETRRGLFITINSVVELIQYSLEHIGVKYVLTEHLTQDCIESFFGQQRMRGGRSDNPTVKSFLDNTRALRTQGSQSLKPFRGNCLRKRVLSTEDSFIDDTTPMPKRARKIN